MTHMASSISPTTTGALELGETKSCHSALLQRLVSSCHMLYQWYFPLFHSSQILRRLVELAESSTTLVTYMTHMFPGLYAPAAVRSRATLADFDGRELSEMLVSSLWRIGLASIRRQNLYGRRLGCENGSSPNTDHKP